MPTSTLLNFEEESLLAHDQIPRLLNLQGPARQVCTIVRGRRARIFRVRLIERRRATHSLSAYLWLI